LLSNLNKLLIAFNDWSKHIKLERKQLENHLMLSQSTKQFSVMAPKQTIGFFHESIGCFGFDSKSTIKTVFNLF